MAEWLIEHGIAEQRALLVEDNHVLAARVRWPGELYAGQTIRARLTSKTDTRGTAIMPDGRDMLVDRLPRDASEGRDLDLMIIRAALTERGRYKRAAARPADTAAIGEDVFGKGRSVHRFPPGLWEEIWELAATEETTFDGGALLFAVTPGMIVVDVDGTLPPRELALAACRPLGRAIRQLDLGGNIGIDFPTLEAKVDRKAVDAALSAALADWPHERTAMNGFGLVQIVARLEGPSLLHRFASARTGMAARMALRRAERIDGAGTTLLTVHPAVKAAIKPEWLGDLERRTGRPVRLESDAGLAIETATAQIVSHD